MGINDCLEDLLKQEPSIWDDSKEIQYRNELGNTLDLFVLQNLKNHILLYDPAMLSEVYKSLFPKVKKEVNKWIDNLGLDQFFSSKFSSLDNKEKREIINSLFEEHLNKITSKLGLGIIKVSEINFEENYVLIEVDESAEGYNASMIGHPICFYMAAFLGGEIGGIFSGWQCYESKCISTGADSCKFVLAPQEQINEEIREFLDLPSRISFTLGGKISSMISEFETEIDYTPILEESVNRISKLFPDMKSEERGDLGHEISLKGFQQYYLSFLGNDFEYGSNILYRAGETSGVRFSRILSALGMRKQDKINFLPRFFDRLGIGLLNSRKNDSSYTIRVKECGYSFNLDVDKKICFFNSGFFAGFLSRTTGLDFKGKEKKCSAESGDYCSHEIYISEQNN